MAAMILESMSVSYIARVTNPSAWMIRTINSTQEHEYKGNYGFNWGQNTYGWQGRPGPFKVGHGTKLREITDGLSNTLAMLEMLQAPSEKVSFREKGRDRRGRIYGIHPGSHHISTKFPPNTSERDSTNCEDRPEIGLPCTDSFPGGSQNLYYLSSRSRHSGGVNAVLCDASVHFYSEDIELGIWRLLASIAGGEVSAADGMVEADPRSQ